LMNLEWFDISRNNLSPEEQEKILNLLPYSVPNF